MKLFEKLKALFTKKNSGTCSVVIVAAGSSTRMGKDKNFLELNGVPVIVRTVRAFDNIDRVKEIVLVTKQENIEVLADVVHNYSLSKVTKVIAGGATRQMSCLAGVSAVNKKSELIAIHDAARPFISEELINNCITEAQAYRAAVPGIKSVDTLKAVDNKGFISGSIDRDYTVRIQTPQVFDADLIKGTLTYCVEKNIAVTDDSSAVAVMGIKTKIVNGDPDNIKLTTPEDMTIAETILKRRGEIL